jgi:predicted TIM-barrel fold metal-dependent hydrolase
VGPERLVFGSDSTLIDPGVTLGAVRAARLDAEEERRVFHANAIEIFGDRVVPRT